MKILDVLKRIFKSNKKYIEDDVFSVCDEVYSSLYNCAIFRIKENTEEYVVEFLNHELYADRLYDYYDEIYSYLVEIFAYVDYNPKIPHTYDHNCDFDLDLNDIRYVTKLKLHGYLLEIDLCRFIGADNILEVDDSEENI